MDVQHWTEDLGEDFWKHPEPFDLRFTDRIRVGSTAAFDHVLRTAAASVVATTAMPLHMHPAGILEMLQSARFYKELAQSHEPEVFFGPAPKVEHFRRDPAWGPVFIPRDGVCEDLTFLSPYNPANPRIQRSYLRHRQNLMAHLRYWRHNDGPRPTIIAIHGFMADAHWLNEWLFALRWFYERLGCDVALFTLPFHGNRQTRYSLFSGHGFFAGGTSRINEAFGQAVTDFRAFFNLLRDHFGVEKIGVTGISLGGYTSALLAAVEDRLEFAVPNVPVISLADVMMEWEPAGTALRTLLGAVGKNVVDLREMLAVASPLNYPSKLPRERLMVIGGVGDRLASPYQQKLIWEHWNRCRLYWFPGSHILHLDKAGFMGAMARFLADIDFLPEPR
ncbi:MAG: alpha/beta hydrolase [Candidatus Dadabacteria bacterium]|nr:MAG: alpha/beta hydrolase [Candidatus Dadabacteria bacterium]